MATQDPATHFSYFKSSGGRAVPFEPIWWWMGSLYEAPIKRKLAGEWRAIVEQKNAADRQKTEGVCDEMVEKIDVTLCKKGAMTIEEDDMIDQIHDELYNLIDPIEELIDEVIVKSDRYTRKEKEIICSALCKIMASLSANLWIGSLTRGIIQKESTR